MQEGDPEALDRLVPLFYDELRRIAREHLRKERRHHTLDTTALVNEAYLKLVRNERIRGESRQEFYAVASETMRRVLVDYARARNRLKRGAGKAPVPLDDVVEGEVAGLLSERQADEVLALEDALGRLATLDERAARVVQHRFFAGLSLEETAEVLDVSVKTVQRSWRTALAWLRKEIAPRAAPDPLLAAGEEPVE